MNKTETPKEELSLLRKASIKIRHGMVLQVVRNRMARIGIDISPYYFFREGVGDIAIPEIKGKASDYVFEYLGPGDMKMAADSSVGYKEEDLLGFLKNGDICIGLKKGGQLAAFMWIGLKEWKFKNITVPLERDEAYLWNMYTMEAFRGINLAPYLRYLSYEALRGMGRNKLYSISEYFNTPAIKFKSKLNARITRFGIYVILFRKFHRDFTLRTYRNSPS